MNGAGVVRPCSDAGRDCHARITDVDEEQAMKALVYHGPGRRRGKRSPNPMIVADTDAIVRVDAVTICGTDLHILKGDVPEVTAGRILGHEAVGTVEAVGIGVKNVKSGDRVLVSCITSCGSCRFCREGHYGLCLGGGGWILGHLIDGTQAEYVRVPFADTSTYPVPAGVTDEQVLMVADILPTGVRGRRAQRARRARRRRRHRRAPDRSASPRSPAPGCTARATSSPSIRRAALRGREAVRCRRRRRPERRRSARKSCSS